MVITPIYHAQSVQVAGPRGESEFRPDPPIRRSWGAVGLHARDRGAVTPPRTPRGWDFAHFAAEPPGASRTGCREAPTLRSLGGGAEAAPRIPVTAFITYVVPLPALQMPPQISPAKRFPRISAVP